jgi:hypothetical protein
VGSGHVNPVGVVLLELYSIKNLMGSDITSSARNMAFSASDVCVVLGLLALVFCIDLYAKRRRMLALTPPGPTPLPFLGNVFDIPSEKSWETYLKWSKKYNSKCQSPSLTAVR